MIYRVLRKLFIIFFLGIAQCAIAGAPSATYHSLDEKACSQLLADHIITHNNPVPCDRLSQVQFSYFNEKGDICSDGKFIVLDTLAPRVASLMDTLVREQFVIAKALPIEAYDGDDNASMADNNSSAFNGRTVTNGSKWSIHAYGAAIDINPVQNPFIDISEDGKALVRPLRSSHYSINRMEHRPGKPPRAGMAEDIVLIFAEHGFFVWGGYWDYPIDYQHFQVGPRSFVKKLTGLDWESGLALLDRYIFTYKNCRKAGGGIMEQRHTICVEGVLKEMQ